MTQTTAQTKLLKYKTYNTKCQCVILYYKYYIYK